MRKEEEQLKVFETNERFEEAEEDSLTSLWLTLCHLITYDDGPQSPICSRYLVRQSILHHHPCFLLLSFFGFSNSTPLTDP